MYSTHRLIVIHPVANMGKPIPTQKNSNGPATKTCQKPYKFDLKVKVQGCIWIMNVRDTLSHGNTPMSQIWLANVKPKKVMGWTRICTDRWTDRE